MQQVKAITLTGYAEVARFTGLDPDKMLRGAGISPETLGNPENLMAATLVIRLLEASVEQSGCQSFGLLMAECRSFASIGPVSLLLEHLPNMLEVVRSGMTFQRHLNDVVEIALEETGDVYLIHHDLVPGYWSAPMSDLVTGIAYQVFARVSGNRWRPDTVHLIRPPPDDLSAWHRFFNGHIAFDSDFDGFSCSRAAMLQPLPLANDELARHARTLLHLMPVTDERALVVDRVRRTITLLMPSGRASLDQVAMQLGMSSRALQRRLEAEGHQFGGLLNQVRGELAMAYLAHSARPITAVAGLLGYASPSSFTRWFVGMFSLSPQEWRTLQGAARQPGHPSLAQH